MVNKPTLEGLPAELHICILHALSDPHSLWSLLRASPVYYYAFQLVKESLLRRLLPKHYAGLVDIADAIAAVRSKGLYAADPLNKGEIIALLDGRRRSDEIRQVRAKLSSSSSPGPLPDEPANVQETMQLLRLHNNALFFLEDYCRTAKRPHWMEETRWDTEIQPRLVVGGLTATEKRRIFRAFYRLQIYANIFGSIERTVDAKYSFENNEWSEYYKRNTFRHREVWQLFFSTMTPWEVEEFSCLWEHCCYRCESILGEVFDSLIQTGCKSLSELPPDQQAPDACCFADCDDLDPDLNKENLASTGPALLCKLLQEPQFLARRNLVLVNARGVVGHFYDSGFWPRPCDDPDDRVPPLLHPADRFDVFGANRTALRALLRTLPPSERPNSLWEETWLSPSNYYYPEVFLDMFDCGPENGDLQWQYALWDDERLIDWKVPRPGHWWYDDFP